MNSVTTIATQLNIGTGGVSVDQDGHIYLADFGYYLGDEKTMGKQILKVTLDGQMEVFAHGFEGASGNELDQAGNLYQSNIRGNRISKIRPDGEITVFATEGIRAPVGIVIDAEQNLFVANWAANSVQKITPDGTSSVFVKSDLLNGPNGITMDSDGHIYVANFDDGNVIKITPEGEASLFATIPGDNNGHMQYHQGSLYVVARSAHQIYKISLQGTVELFAGNGEKGCQDGPALEASFCYPNDIKPSADGTALYVNHVMDTKSNGRTLAPTVLRSIAL